MLPKLDKDEIELLEHVKNYTPMDVLEKIYGNQFNFYRLRKKIFKKIDASLKLSIHYQVLGLDYYFVLGNCQFSSPYLTQHSKCYFTIKKHVSRFCIPPQHRTKFFESVKDLDPGARIFEAREIAGPTYNFNYFKNEYDEFGVLNYLKLYLFYEFPILKPAIKHQLFEFNRELLDLLHHDFNDLPVKKILKLTGLINKAYYALENKMKGNLYEKVMDIGAFYKLLFFLDNTNHQIEDPMKLISSMMELFIFCHPYEIHEVPMQEKKVIKDGFLCLLTPPTTSIPFFTHIFGDYLEFGSDLYYVEKLEQWCNVNQALDPSDGLWAWLDVSTIK